MRISDWSSDVCSSDLDDAVILRAAHRLDALAVLGAAGIDVIGDVGRSDEADRLDGRMVEDGVDHFLVAVDDVQDARRNARLDRQFSQAPRDGGIAVRGFPDEGVDAGGRSESGRGGKAGVRTSRSRWALAL